MVMEKIMRSVSLCIFKKIYAYVHTNLHMYGHKYIPTYIQLYVYASSAQFFKFTTDIISIIFYETKLSECLMSILCLSYVFYYISDPMVMPKLYLMLMSTLLLLPIYCSTLSI